MSKRFENFVSQTLGVLTRIYAAELRSKTVRQNFDIETYNNKFIIVPQDNTRVNKPMIVK